MIKFLPQVLLIAIYGYGLYEAKKNNGKNINVSFWNEVMAVMFFIALLFWGGFFSNLIEFLIKNIDYVIEFFIYATGLGILILIKLFIFDKILDYFQRRVK